MKYDDEEIIKLQNKINNVLSTYQFIRYNRFFFFARPEFNGICVYWIKYTTDGDIHSRTKYLNSKMSDIEIAKAIKFPIHQWIIQNRAKSMRRKPDWNHLNLIVLKENVDRLRKEYPNSNIEVKATKVKGLERFYLNYDFTTMGSTYRKKTKKFKVTENEYSFLYSLLEKHRRYMS